MNKTPLKVCIADLRHRTLGRHSPFIPVGIGYIASYAEAQAGDGNLDLRLYDDIDKIMDDIDTWQPDILALANYCWNSQAAELVFRYAKKNNPGIVCVSGGPNFPQLHGECHEYLKDRPFIYYYAYREGELAFSDLVNAIRDGGDLEDMKARPQTGMMSINPQDGSLVVGPEAPRLIDMDVIPSPYLTGILEQWFDGTYAPGIETARGCPFSCLFCVQGDENWSQMGRFSVDRVNAEFTYMAERMKGHEDVLLGLYDANFGMYKRDEKLAIHLRHLQDTYSWPNAFEVTTGKAQYNRILKIADILQNKMIVTCSVQSWNEDTLDLIQRKNLPREQYREIVKEVKSRGLRTVSESIMPLPSETKETFLAGIRFLLDSGIETIIAYTTMLLRGTRLSSAESREKYAMKSAYRILPHQFGQYRGEKCYEIDEVCIETNTMSFEDYLECRGFAFIATIFSREQFDVCQRLLAELGGDMYDWFIHIWERAKSGQSQVSTIYYEFLEETRTELFDSEQAIYDFFEDDENYTKLLSGELGDNLMRKYTTRIMLELCLPAFDSAFDSMNAVIPDASKHEAVLGSAKKWLHAVRDVGAAFKDTEYLDAVETLDLDHDVNAWWEQGNDGNPLTQFEKPSRYRLYCEGERVKDFLDQQMSLYDSMFFVASKYFNYFRPNDLWRLCELQGAKDMATLSAELEQTTSPS